MYKFKKLISIFLLVIISLSCFQNYAFATEISKANLKNDHSIKTNLQFKSSDGTWHDLICNYIAYTNDGTLYPAYCIKHGYHGVDEEGSYTVSINKLLSDNKIWRTIINGYPYKTPNELGVETKDDAYLATKQAIYSVILNRDVKSYYQGTNEKGKKVVNAIYNISQIGKNGTQTMQSANLKLKQVKGLTKFNENYYYQEFKASADVSVDSIKVDEIKGFPSGSFISDTAGNGKTTFSGNENIRVMIPRNNINKDFEGTINITGKCKTYPIYFGEAPKSDIQDYAITYSTLESFSAKVSSKEKVNNAIINVLKADEETNKPIEGVEFQLLNSNGAIIDTKITNDKGRIIFDNLFPDKYILKETKTNDKYIFEALEKEINIKYDETIDVTFTNKHKKGNLSVLKVDKDNNKISLGNVKFDLYSEEFDKVIGSYTTNVDGEIKVNDLRIGNYKLIERNTGKWYNLSEDKNIVIRYNDTTNTLVENELKKGSVKVVKVDKENHDIKLKDVEFNVLDSANRVLETIITDENGEAVTSKYSLRDYENIKIQETKTNEYYKLNNDILDIQLVNNEQIKVVVENEMKKGQIRLIKVDKDNNSVRIPNVEFEILDNENNIIETLITDENGEAISKLLPINKNYYIKETKTDNLYVLNEEIKEIELEEDKIKDITFENEKKKGQIKVVKSDAETQIPLEGVKFEIKDSKGNVVDYLVTDKEGTAISNRLPIDETYEIKEIETAKGYKLEDEVHIVNVEYKEIKELEIINNRERGNIKIIKKSSDGNNICGINFKVSGTSVTGDYFEQVFTTDDNGEILIKDMLVGNYTIEELENEINCNYILPEQKTIEVKDEETSEIEFYNELIELPKTGVDNHINILLIILIVVYSCGIVLIIRELRRDDENDKI